MRKMLVTLLLALGVMSDAHAQEYVFKFGNAASPTHLIYRGQDMFAKAVAEKTGGRVKIEIYGDRQLGDDRQLLEGVQLGTIDGASVSASTMPLALGANAFDALQLPFLVEDYDTMGEVLSSETGQKILDSLSAYNIKGLGFIEAGQRHFLSKSREVRKVSDFAGLKTRIIPIPLHKAIWEAVGTNPVGMAYGEIYSALETGTIDAVEINLSSVQSESLYQAARNVTLTGHYFFPGVLMMPSDKFDALPDDIKAAFVEAGRELTKAHYALAGAEEEQTAAKLKEEGVSIFRLEDVDEMRKLTQPVVDQWISKDPLIKEFVDEVNRTH